MKTIDELLAEGVAGKRVFVRADLNVPLDGSHHHRRRPHPRRRCRRSAKLAEARRQGGRRLAPGPPQGRPGPGLLARARPPQRLGELLGADVAFATDTVGAVRHGRRRRPAPTARSPCWRTSASTPARPVQGRRRARRLRRPARRPRRRLRRRRLRRRAPQARLRLRPAGAPAARRRLPHRHRGRRPEEAHRGRQAPVRRRARRRQGLRQARRHRPAARQGRPHPDRRRHGVHLPQGQGPRGRHLPPPGGPDPGRQGVPGAGREAAASSSCSPSTSWSPPSSRT